MENVPPQVHERVSFGPPPDWIRTHEVDYSYRPPVDAASSMLLVDHQHHATRHESYHRVVQRLDTIASVQQSAQWRCEFDPATQWLIIHSLSVQRESVSREHASANRLRILQREESLELLVLDGRLSVVALLEDIRVGDIIDASYTIRTKPRIFADQYSLVTAVPISHYTRSFQLAVRFPKGHAMRWQTDSKKITLTERDADNGETEWSWSVENFAPRPVEPGIPSWYFQGRFIQVTDHPSWQSVASGFAQYWSEEFAHPALVDTIKEIAILPTLVERVERALRLVQDDLRYLSATTELGGQVPSSPGTVLQRRFGDCKDKAFLLVHLLRGLGVSARPVLVHGQLQRRIEQFLPTPDAFNHVIVEFELAGERRCVDATIALQGGGPLGRALPSFGMGLPIGPAVTELEPVSSSPAADGSYEVHEAYHLETVGAPMHLQVTTTASGAYADGLRRQILFEGSAAAAKARESVYQRQFSAALRTAELEWRDDRDRNQFVAADAYQLPDVIIATGEPGVAAFQYSAHVVQGAIAFHDTQRRKHPLAVPFPCRIRHQMEFQFETLNQTIRSRQAVDAKAFWLDVDERRLPHRTVLTFYYQTCMDHVAPEDFAKHRDDAHASWGQTQFGFYLPTGRRFAGTYRKPASLLPPMPEPEPASIPQQDPPEPEPAGAAEIAPCLSSLPPVQRNSVVETVRANQESGGGRRLGTTRPRAVRGPSNAKTVSATGLVIFIVIILIRVVIAMVMNGR